MIKRIACLLLAAILLGAAAGLPASGLFAAAADGTEAFADLANRIRSTGAQSGSGYLLSYDLDAESRELFAALYRPEQGVIELSVTYDGYMCASLTIPAALSTLYKVTSSFQSAGGSARGTAWLDPAAYTGAEPPALSDYTGDEGFRQGVISILRRFLPHLVEELGVLLWADGHLLSDLGFTGFTVHTKHLFRTEPDPDEPPTCTEDGFLRRTCVVCGTVSREPAPALGHDWDAGEITTAPTCISPGVRTFRCLRCAGTRTETLPANGEHAWVRTALQDPSGEEVHCTGTFVCTVCGTEQTRTLCAADVFTDAPSPGSWAHAPVDWAYFHGITAGDSATKFRPDKVCTRGQTVTFLWRAAGKPEPTAEENPFRDVNPGDYYYKAVLWAVEQGITKGESKTRFAPAKVCTRAQVVTFLYRAHGSPPVEGTNPFRDVSESDYFCKPVLWATQKGVTQGLSRTHFGPRVNCTRAQTVTFLYRAKDITD